MLLLLLFVSVDVENVAADDVVVASVDVTVGSAVADGDLVEEESAMSPDSNHNHQLVSPSKELVAITMKLVKNEPESSEDESHQMAASEDVRIEEYLNRTDTAVIFPEEPQAVAADNGKLSLYSNCNRLHSCVRLVFVFRILITFILCGKKFMICQGLKF